MGDRICTVSDCGKKHEARGYCAFHYERFRCGVDLLAPYGGAADPAERFWSHVLKSGSDGCWLWTSALQVGGYGLFRVTRSQQAMAHRFAYTLLRGPVPDGLELDHLCRVRRCVNPQHLEAVTAQVNNLRGTSPAATNAAKTHCKWGHEFAPENTGKASNGGRYCRQCQRAANRRQRAAKRGRAGDAQIAVKAAIAAQR